MRLARRQAKAINQIIQEEVQGALRARKERTHLLRRGEIQERLVEAGPDAMRVDWSVMGSQLEDASYDMSRDMADDMVYAFRQKIERMVAQVLNQHAMATVKMDPRTFGDELEEFDPDGVMEISQECTIDIVEVLQKYAKQIGELAVHMSGGEPATRDRFGSGH